MIDGREIVMYDETIQTNGEQIRKTMRLPAHCGWYAVFNRFIVDAAFLAFNPRINTGDRYYYYMFCSWQQ